MEFLNTFFIVYVALLSNIIIALLFSNQHKCLQNEHNDLYCNLRSQMLQYNIEMFSILLLLNSFLFIHCSVAPTHLFVTRVGPCVDANNSIVTLSEMKVTRKLYDFSVSGELNISKDITDGWTVKATMEKCQDIRNLDTCDFFRSFPVIKGGCSAEHLQDGDVYNMFFHYTFPRLNCPLRAGIYKISSYPFFMEDNYLSVSESKLSTSVFGYTFRLEGYSDYEKVACADAYLQLVYIREHNWAEVDYPNVEGSTEPASNEYKDSEQ